MAEEAVETLQKCEQNSFWRQRSLRNEVRVDKQSSDRPSSLYANAGMELRGPGFLVEEAEL